MNERCDGSFMTVAMRRRKKERKQRRYMELSSTVEELMETPTFKRFYSALDTILDAADDMDLAGMRGTDMVVDWLERLPCNIEGAGSILH